MSIFKRGRRPPDPAPPPVQEVQLRGGARHPFRTLDGYVPLRRPEFALYRAIREAIPVVDAAVWKLVRLSGGPIVRCGDPAAERALGDFLRTVPVGRGQYGIQAFLDGYLDCLLTCGRAVGEIVPTRDGRDIAAVLCGDVARIEVRDGRTPLETELAVREEDGRLRALPRQDLLLFTPYHPSPAEPYGESLLHSLPFLAEILLKIYQTLGANWERAGNVRFAVVYRPGEEGQDPRRVQERSQQLARTWSEAMQATRSGAVRDFVAAGDVQIRVIGAECGIPECQTSVRLIVEQLIAQTGIPPFLLGLNWSSTERLSSQQADIMTSELTALRRTLTPVLERICRLWLRMHGWDVPFTVDWEDIDLQDQVEEAKARLYLSQAARNERETAAMASVGDGGGLREEEHEDEDR